jgi:hypothetical protein
MFGEDWIHVLTRRERWLLSRYVDGDVRPPAPSSAPGHIAYINASTGRPFLNPSLQEEVDKAQDRREWRNYQRNQIRAWFRDNGFISCLERTAFERAFTRDFDRVRALQSEPRRGPKPGETGFNAADSALFSEIAQIRKSGKARSNVAAARLLVKESKVASSGGSDENRAARLARRYGKWKSDSDASEAKH